MSAAGKTQRQPNPRRLTYSAAFRALDEVDMARADLDGTFAVLTSLIDVDLEMAVSHMAAMERHLKTDYDALKAAIGKARKTILTRLHVQQAHDDPPEEEAQPAASLAVENGGVHGDAA